MAKNKQVIWDKSFKRTMIVFVSFILIVFSLPYLMSTRSWFGIDFRTTGQIGDTIGGVTAPFIAFAASVLTFIAFWVQYKANEQQRDDIHVERFESKFYELLRLHKDNVDEFYIGTSSDFVEKRKSFVSLYNEFRFTFFCCKSKYDELIKNKTLKTEYQGEDLVRLAYIFFYCGIGANSDIMSRAMNGDKKFDEKLFEAVLRYLSDIKENKVTTPTFRDADDNEVSLTVKYKAWGGHQSRLGHYYRHLFQTVKFVAKQNDDVIDDDDKIEYLRTLRAQLSDHEQLMLYYNAISGFGGAWIKDEKNNNANYFVSYKMIHNIPLPLANFGIKPEVKFAAELKANPALFEWSE